MKYIAALESLNIPTHDFIRAVQYVMAKDRDVRDTGFHGNFTAAQYADQITSILDIPTPIFPSDKYARLFFGYLVQEIVKRYNNQQEIPEDLKLWSIVTDNVKQHVIKSPWSVAEYTEENVEVKPRKQREKKKKITTDKKGRPLIKKGNKLAVIKQIFEDNKNKNLTKKQWLEIMMDKAQTTKVGAVNYYYSYIKKNLEIQ